MPLVTSLSVISPCPALPAVSSPALTRSVIPSTRHFNAFACCHSLYSFALGCLPLLTYVARDALTSSPPHSLAFCRAVQPSVTLLFYSFHSVPGPSPAYAFLLFTVGALLHRPSGRCNSSAASSHGALPSPITTWLMTPASFSSSAFFSLKLPPASRSSTSLSCVIPLCFLPPLAPLWVCFYCDSAHFLLVLPHSCRARRGSIARWHCFERSSICFGIGCDAQVCLHHLAAQLRVVALLQFHIFHITTLWLH